MKKNLSYILWPIAFLAVASLTPSCGGEDEPTGDGDGIGDGDGDGGKGGAMGGDGDGDTGGTSGDGDMGGNGGAMPLDCEEECENDDNPCTEDVCNPETGKCGVPRTGNSCDDGLFCTGTDVCDDGVCVSDGNPCQTDPTDLCDEGANVCKCADDSECGDDIGEGEYGSISDWSACVYDDACDEAGTRSRSRIVRACESGVCEQVSVGAEVDNNCDVRDTDGDKCEQNKTYCDGSEVCEGGSCTGHTGDPCFKRDQDLRREISVRASPVL